MIFLRSCKAVRLWPVGLIFFLIGIQIGSMPASADLKVDMLLQSVKMPPGFKIQVYTDQVPGARSLAVSPSGVVYVGTRQNGRVYAVIDRNRDGVADRVITAVQDLTMPNGVAFYQGDLFVAEVGRILRFADIEAHLDRPGRPEVVYDQLPEDLENGWKFISFGPDGMLYVSIGAQCNACPSENPVYATIARMNRDGSGFEVFARGVRHSLGFDWHPGTGELWFTDNSRDPTGDDLLQDEMNRAPVQGLHFGFPFCHSGNIPDPQIGKENGCSDFTPPATTLGGRVVPLGMQFYTGTMFPPQYQGQIFIAEHGSWDRTEKRGYQVTMVRLRGDRVDSVEPFAWGWLLDHSDWGRPVDVAVMPDGSMLISDDLNGVIYRIFYQPQENPTNPINPIKLINPMGLNPRKR